ncbi:hypothetical protein GQ44DRAFT_560020, partial [Phaeosphaeriaceae sp. PMI808]
QIRLFLFAGHGTTRGVLIYNYHMLHKQHEILECMKDARFSVFGVDASRKPSLTNQTPYTLAVTKETMRMLP